ncbi:hypothetical protein F66182_10383 [Fusarium sp. NRRL 66182]|nr:hypothetical protein F66182_10383 [Fusarium sp. NRRL 66182]
MLQVPKIDMLGMIDPLPRPEPFEKGRAVFASFMKRSHSIVTLLLDIFNDSLQLPKGTLSSLHQLEAMSGDAVRLIKAPPQPRSSRQGITLPEHTDYGSITFVFNQLGGLQVLPPGRDAQYLYVEPLPGHMIVNIGDALVKFTNGLFRSNIHRIVAPPGAQGDFTRYSVVYFSRPNDHVHLKRLEGSRRIPPLAEGVVEEVINSKDWILRRGLGRRAAQAKVDLEGCAGTENLSRRIPV